jgi:hypothetical protein
VPVQLGPAIVPPEPVAAKSLTATILWIQQRAPDKLTRNSPHRQSNFISFCRDLGAPAANLQLLGLRPSIAAFNGTVGDVLHSGLTRVQEFAKELDIH